MALGSFSTTTPSISITSAFDMASTSLWLTFSPVAFQMLPHGVIAEMAGCQQRFPVRFLPVVDDLNVFPVFAFGAAHRPDLSIR